MALIRNLSKIRNMPEYGKLLVEALQDVQKQLLNVSSQTNASLSSAQNAPPPSINALHVDGGAGIYHAYITDNNQNLYRGAEYTLEYSNDNWQTFHVEHMGPSRDRRLNLGETGPFQFRAYSGYGPASGPSSAIYASGPVSGAGSTAPPLRAGQGSGTNFPSQGASGYGTLQYRGNESPKRS